MDLFFSGPVDLFFTSFEMKERVGVWVDLFFMSSEIRKRIKIPTDLFFTSFEMRERVGSSGPLLHELGNKKAN